MILTVTTKRLLLSQTIQLPVASRQTWPDQRCQLPRCNLKSVVCSLHFLSSLICNRIGTAIGRTWFGDHYGSNVSTSRTVVNNHFTGAFSYAIAMSSATNFTVENNDLFGNTSSIDAIGPNCSTGQVMLTQRHSSSIRATSNPLPLNLTFNPCRMVIASHACCHLAVWWQSWSQFVIYWRRRRPYHSGSKGRYSGWGRWRCPIRCYRNMVHTEMDTEPREVQERA